jgi:hypothetical protein
MDSKSTTRAFPGFENLFRLTDILANPPFRGEMSIEKPFRLLRGELSPAAPVRVKHAMGGKPGDLIWTTWAAVFLIAERVRKLLEDAHVTGWKTYPVEVTDRQKAIVPGYHGFAVTGRCGAFDPSKSQIVIKPAPVPRGRASPFRRGLYFDPATWDGSDVFCSDDGSGTVVVTPRVQELFRRNKLTNVRFQRLTDFEVLVAT